MSPITVVRAEGDPVYRGRTIGRELGDMIERSMDFYHRYFERRGVASRELQDILSPYLVAAETHFPDFMALIKAMAEGAMVPVWELFAVNAFEELEPILEPVEGGSLFLMRKEGRAPAPATPAPPPRRERCSSVTVTGPGVTLLGHNEHWLAGDLGNVAIVVETLAHGTASVASPTVVCCLPSVGINEYRGAQGIASLTASDDGVGVPRVLISRHSLEASDRMDAVRRASHPDRAGGYGHTYAFAGGDAFMVETTRTRHSVLEGPGPHTNHYLDPELAEMGAEPSAGSTARYDRLLQLLEERSPSTPEGLMDILRDHEGAPTPICLHPDEAEGDEAAAVVFSMVADLEAGRMWVAAGNPCTSPYEEIDLTGVTS
jgi:isopenicillin-N N-acyltransferase like protein